MPTPISGQLGKTLLTASSKAFPLGSKLTLYKIPALYPSKTALLVAFDAPKSSAFKMNFLFFKINSSWNYYITLKILLINV